MSILEQLVQVLGDSEGDGNPLLWRPHIPNSIDSKPLATSPSELFWDFPYDRLPENQVIAFFMRPETMFGLALFYLVSKEPLRWFRDAICFNPKSETFTNFVALHNLALAVFSAVTVWNSWGVVFAHLLAQGWIPTYCDLEWTSWNSGIGAWTTIFYISKYYEFFDTWILVLKGKKPSFLQVYHHTGIVFCMWGGTVSQSAWLLFIVLLNSIIHTFMYTYFFIKTLYPNIEIKSAKHLTMAQIGQLAIGISFSFGYVALGDSCSTPASRLTILFMQIYGFSLVALFVAFANRKYKKKTA
ncbi:of very long chain fatty acids protein 6 [Seminavis robusta]|uniref:Elongation of fatty acids protein n=1 Tax=Seminavis robusta TaxID=568900 RepID=A0A9N8DTU5_9STRA|nr:of very long chain fatty acids protein 6 [Seminavis robusta]|eukprot:Sro352_g124360.1 of very long chain fatty acids protein 6 (299) ;mRNA; f:72036-72932